MTENDLNQYTLASIARLYEKEGPFLTVLVPSESTVEQAADIHELQWKNTLRELADLGVDPDLVEAVSDARGEHYEGATRLVIATIPDKTVRLAISIDAETQAPIVDVAALPHLMPLVEAVTEQVPHVVVYADHAGADVEAYTDEGDLADEVTVKGRTLHLKKVQVGGWAHRRYQERTENQWKENAEASMTAVLELAQEVGAELIIAVGEERQLHILRDQVPPQHETKWREVPGGRGHDGSGELVEERVQNVVSTYAAERTLSLLETYAAERGQRKKAADGLEATIDTLRKAQVETLLLTTDPLIDPLGGADGDTAATSGTSEETERDLNSEGDQDLVQSALREDEVTPALAQTLYYGPDPLHVGLSRSELLDLGVAEDQIKEGPLVDVLLRAAIGGGSSVMLVPHQSENAPEGGIGAVLRYADGPTDVNRRAESSGDLDAGGSGHVNEDGDTSPYPSDKSASTLAGANVDAGGAAGGDGGTTGAARG